jgi:nucleosome-remodeling factor subunit BPTF
LVNYKESEYHYGSDFEEDDADDYAEAVESEKSSEESDMESTNDDSDDLKVESDVDLDEIVPTSLLPQTPMPFWLRDDENIPSLELPKSSEDLLVPNQFILRIFSIYEILRRFHQILRLTPFRIEDFCAALASEEQSNLLSEVHMALMKTIVRAEESNGATFGPIEQKDSINCILFFSDSVTWPDSLKAVLQSDPVYAEPLKIFESCDYPFASSNEEMLEKRIEMLSFLSDQILSTTIVRDFITEDGLQTNEEHCRICHRLGEMLVCDTCPGVYHLGCLDPPLHDVPEEEWRCYICKANEVEGVTDCQGEKNSACREDCLGIDRSGNKYWFMCRRLVVEKVDGNVNYYSTVKQLEELSEVLDDEVYEKELWESMEDIRIEMERQMDITEEITNKRKSSSKKSYFEVENGKAK